MHEPAFTTLARWANFYVIAGSSAGALTGLQFVVMTLIAGSERRGSMREIRAFGSPTVVHFGVALFISGIMCAPWSAYKPLAWCLGTVGAAGLLYGISVVWHARKQEGYRPDPGDWFWYTVAPLLTYTALFASAVAFSFHPELLLFVLAAVTLSLLFIGMHNAWDTVTYLVVEQHKRPGSNDAGDPEQS